MAQGGLPHHREVDESVPSQQGLKLGVLCVFLCAVRVDESVPSQQGLKPELPEVLDRAGLVDESVPSQQGLKQLPGNVHYALRQAVDESVPSQQGLKLRLVLRARRRPG